MDELDMFLSRADTDDYYADKECRKKPVMHFYSLYVPLLYLTDVVTDLGLKDDEYEILDKDRMIFKTVKTIEQVQKIVGRREKHYVIIEAKAVALSGGKIKKF